jgi:PhnB protein
MILITPTFNFNGHCEEAINLYEKAFNGRVGCLLRYSDADIRDWNKELNSKQANYIYHAELFIGDQRIIMSDNIDIDFVQSTSLSLTVTFETKDEVQNAYEILKEDSTIIYPLHSTTYSSCIVVVIDKFGFRWGLMTEQTER